MTSIDKLIIVKRKRTMNKYKIWWELRIKKQRNWNVPKSFSCGFGIIVRSTSFIFASRCGPIISHSQHSPALQKSKENQESEDKKSKGNISNLISKFDYFGWSHNSVEFLQKIKQSWVEKRNQKAKAKSTKNCICFLHDWEKVRTEAVAFLTNLGFLSFFFFKIF